MLLRILILLLPLTLTAELTLEEKVGQLLMVHFHGKTATEEARDLIQNLHAGGIIYYSWANGLSSPEQTAALSRELQALARESGSGLPLIIAVDQEGGRVVRIQGLSVVPSYRLQGQRDDPAAVEALAYTAGSELKNSGITLNLAPVVDIDSNPLNPIIGERSFGAGSPLVIRLGSAVLKGYQRAGIGSCLKHFPGHGDAAADSHQTLPRIDKPLKELERLELAPFAALASEADCVMTGHLLVPALDPIKPATLSKPTLDYLKNELHFSGPILTDSLVMEGLLKTVVSVDAAAIEAIAAGCDILLLGGKLIEGTCRDRELTPQDIRRIRNSLLEAVRDGRLSEERIDDAVAKILRFKERHG